MSMQSRNSHLGWGVAVGAALIGLLVGVGPAHAATTPELPPVSFASHADFAVHGEPTAMTVADFNSDGVTDLVTANTETDDVSVLLGTGTGSFGPASHVAVGDSPISVAIGDLNDDGTHDLATANVLSGDVTVRLGTGTGSFGPPKRTPVQLGQQGVSIVVADFTVDGFVDMVVNGIGCARVLVGNGTGAFRPGPRCFDWGAEASSIVAGDFTRDGHADLAAALGDRFAVGVLPGAGDGTFGDVVSYPLGVEPYRLAVADIVGDGVEDLVTVNLNAEGKEVSVLVGDGAGSFAAPVHSAAPDGFDLDVTEFNGDGIHDLVTVGGHLDDAAYVLVGTGTGSFILAARHPLDPGAEPNAVLSDDFNGDLRADFATANTAENDISIVLNTTPSRMGIADAARAEGGSGTPSVFVTVTLEGEWNQTVTVRFKTRDGSAVAGSDYVAKEGIVTFAPGVESVVVKLSLLGDKVVEPTEAFFVDLSRVVGAVVEDRTARITVRNDDK